MSDSEAGPSARPTQPLVQLPHTPNSPTTSYRTAPSVFKVSKSLELFQGSSNWDMWAFKLMNVIEAEGGGTSSRVIPHIQSSTSSAYSWKALSDAYKSKGLLTAFHYRNQLVMAHFNETQPLRPQTNWLQQLRVKQITTSIPCKDWDFAICLLGALPEPYSITKQAILASQTDLHKLNLASIATLITQDEMEKKGFINSMDTNTAFTA
ncbi:hypothetical protein FRB90_001406 [Tulasnella sp. 427]|nr:hypothetical protein FRB90_001406 [Tulasnella sp. 427]